MALLAAHVRKVQPELPLFVLNSWKPEECAEAGGWEHYLDAKFSNFWTVDEYILLIDEGQTTYADWDLWNVFFKQIHTQPGTKKRIAIFCSYGTPGRRAISNDVPMPQILENSARISLLPDSSETRPPVGLLFTDIEYNEAIKAFRHDNRPVLMDAALRQYILNLTSGHPGAVVTLLRLCAMYKVLPQCRFVRFTC